MGLCASTQTLGRKGLQDARAGTTARPVPAHILAMQSVDWDAVRSTGGVPSPVPADVEEVVNSETTEDGPAAEVAVVDEKDGAIPAGLLPVASVAATPDPGLGLSGLNLSFVGSPSKRRRLSLDERAVLNEFWECSSCSSSERGDHERMSEIEA